MASLEKHFRNLDVGAPIHKPQPASKLAEKLGITTRDVKKYADTPVVLGPAGFIIVTENGGYRIVDRDDRGMRRIVGNYYRVSGE